MIGRTEAPADVPGGRTVVWGLEPRGLFLSLLPNAAFHAANNAMIRKATSATSWADLLRALGPGDLAEYFEVELDAAWDSHLDEYGLDDSLTRPPVDEWLPEHWSEPTLDWLSEQPSQDDVAELGLPEAILAFGESERGTPTPMTGGSGVSVTWSPGSLVAIDDWLQGHGGALIRRQDIVDEIFGL